VFVFASQTVCGFRISPSIYQFKERPQNPLVPVIFNTTSGAYAAPPRPRRQAIGQSPAREDAGAQLVAFNFKEHQPTAKFKRR
jgi:hypothetical protein